jgi:hypothetical protein
MNIHRKICEMNIDAFAKLIELHSRIIQDATTHKQMLIRIVLDTIDAKTRLEHIKRILLESKSENPSIISNALSEMPGLTISQMEGLTELIYKVIEPSVAHRTLLNKIGDVLNSNHSNDEKIDMIGNLLV